MKLLRVIAENVRALPDGAYTFAHPVTGMVIDTALVTGPAGSGKTTLLEAIVVAKERIAGYGPPPNPRSLLRRGANNGRVVVTFVLDPDELARAGLNEPVQPVEAWLSGGGSGTRVDPRMGKLLSDFSEGASRLCYFPAQRRLDPPQPVERAPSSRDLVRLCVDREGDKFGPVVRWICQRLAADQSALAAQLVSTGVALASHAPDGLAAFRKALAAMCPQLRLANLPPESGMPWFERVDGATLTLDELSDSERDAVLLSGTCALFAFRRSIVLIDRLDLFACGQLEESWLAALATLAPDCQFVVTTSGDGASSSEAHVVRLGGGART